MRIAPGEERYLKLKGTVSYSKEIRKDLDSNKGDTLVMERVDDGVILRRSSRKEVRQKHKLRGLLKGEDMDPEECEAILEEAKKTLTSSSYEPLCAYAI